MQSGGFRSGLVSPPLYAVHRSVRSIRNKKPAPRVALGSGLLPSSLMKLDVVIIQLLRVDAIQESSTGRVLTMQALHFDSIVYVPDV